MGYHVTQQQTQDSSTTSARLQPHHACIVFPFVCSLSQSAQTTYGYTNERVAPLPYSIHVATHTLHNPLSSCLLPGVHHTPLCISTYITNPEPRTCGTTASSHTCRHTLDSLFVCLPYSKLQGRPNPNPPCMHAPHATTSSLQCQPHPTQPGGTCASHTRGHLLSHGKNT